MKFIKNFENHQGYEAYIAEDYPKPNVSYCVQENEVHYKAFVPPYSGFCKLTLNNGNVVEIEGSGELKSGMTRIYTATCVSAEIGTLCTSIGGSAFYNCRNLTSITIPNSVTSIGGSAFQNCASLISVTIGSGVTSIGSNAFNSTSLTNITIPNGVTSIAYQAFYGCGRLTSVTIGSNVTSIANLAFAYCHKLTSINIPSGVTSIGGSAFEECSGLTIVTLPSGVTSIGDRAFYYCRGLTNITIEAKTPPTLGNGAFSYTANNSIIYVPAESVDTYKTTWSGYSSKIQPIPTT